MLKMHNMTSYHLSHIPGSHIGKIEKWMRYLTYIKMGEVNGKYNYLDVEMVIIVTLFKGVGENVTNLIT